MTTSYNTQIAIIGGGLGGSAAALVQQDYETIIAEQSDWLGGQVSSQGVAPLDEHDHIEAFGGTLAYTHFRADIRKHYRDAYNAPEIMPQSVLGPNRPLNPGNGWVSRLCFDPRVALHSYDPIAQPPPNPDSAGTPFSLSDERASARPHTMFRVWPIHADVQDGRIQSVTLQSDEGEISIQATYYLDATDLGDLLPLTNTPYITGAEAFSDTGEAGAPDTARPGEIQGFTFPFAVEFCPGEDHTISKPDGYEWFRDHQPYTLTPIGRDGQPVIYKMFEHSEQGNLPFWTYRRIHDGALLGGNDISLINWVSNDYHGKSIIDVSAEARDAAIDEAKRLSLGFLYWLQTECPRDDDPDKRGYPELKLRPDMMGTDDGLSQAPYIRESRRIVPMQRVTASDVSAENNPGARARHFTDSVGLGWYALDLHPCVGNPSVSMYAPTRPFQVPLGALIPAKSAGQEGPDNLIAACKNIGTTHLSNGAYRTHPTEWAIGEAAAMLARFCIHNDMTPRDVYADRWQVWRLQYQLVRRGCPIFWALDMPLDHALFVPTQLLLARDLIVPDSPRYHQLEIGLDQPLGDSIDLSRLNTIADDINEHGGRLMIRKGWMSPDVTWATVCDKFGDAMKKALE
jgi:hypothetical protein